MTAFVIIAAIMIVFGLAWVLPPLLRGATRKPIDRAAVNLGILKDQLAELEAEHARGAMPEPQYVQNKAELERRVLDEAQAETVPPPPPATWHGRVTAAMLVVAVPVAAALLYVRMGEPDAFNPLAREGTEAAHQFGPAELEKMTQALAERLKSEPDNANGWSTLARTYYTSGRYQEAVQAYEKLVALVPTEASLFADYADALAMAQGRRLAGKPMELINKALQLDPLQWKALAMAGTEAFERKDYKSAVALWEKLQRSLPPEAPIAQQIGNSIAEARQLGGIAATPPVASAPALTPAPAPTAPVATAAAPVASAAAPAASASARVAGTVSLSAQLGAKAAPTDTVFIFARAAEGPRMPLALLRVQVKDLPKSFSLDDSMAISPDFKLSNFPEVVIGARISKSGNAMPNSGDLEGLSERVRLGGDNIKVTIDRVLP